MHMCGCCVSFQMCDDHLTISYRRSLRKHFSQRNINTVVFFHTAAGWVCSERLHTVGSNTGGDGKQTHLHPSAPPLTEDHLHPLTQVFMQPTASSRWSSESLKRSKTWRHDVFYCSVLTVWSAEAWPHHIIKNINISNMWNTQRVMLWTTLTYTRQTSITFWQNCPGACVPWEANLFT